MTLALLTLALAGPSDDFASANAALARGDLAAAEAGYRGLLDGGIRDADVYYNLGNVLYRQGRLPGAILAWRHAAALDPRDPDASANLDFVRRSLPERVVTPDPRPDFAPWQSALSPAEGQWIGEVLVALGLTLVALRRRLARVPVAVGPAVAAVGLWVWAGGMAEAAASPVAVVLAPEARVTSDLGGGVELFVLRAGAEVGTVDEEAGSVLVVLPDGRKGWVAAEMVGFVDPDRPFPVL